MPAKAQKFIYWFTEIDKADVELVGGKGANLGEMTNFGIPVPPGFIISAGAYHYALEKNNLKARIKELLAQINPDRPESFDLASRQIKKLITDSPVPKEISLPVIKAYFKLGGLLSSALVAVRSSATAEDLPDASFAGQQSTYLNVKGETQVIEKLREAWASLFEARAIFYRQEKGFDHFKVGLAAPVQKMVQSAKSGIMFTCDPVTGAKNRIVIEAIYGLGELIVQGQVTPDHYVLDRDSLRILLREPAEQRVKLVKQGLKNLKVAVAKRLQNKQKLTDGEIQALARLAKKIHEHYFFPQDIEWAIDNKGQVFIVQTRPVTTLPKETDLDLRTTKAEFARAGEQIENKKIILSGAGASSGIGWGKVIIISSRKEIGRVGNGDVLVTSMTTPDFVPAMKKVAAIVTDHGGQTSHAAIVSRELGVPCVVGTTNATRVLKNGQMITVDGTAGKVYTGGLTNQPQTIPLPPANSRESTSAVQTSTKIYVNLAEESLAKPVAQKNVDGVGLLRAEFMIAGIGVHPKKMIKDGQGKAFTERLAAGMAEFCRAFFPRPVVYRTTDFKTNEYRSLKGGDLYEPVESNPMLGYRGAYRYLADEEVFALELAAIKKVRNQLGLNNLWLMIPYVHTPSEMRQIKKVITSHGLIRSPSFQLWMMVEIPANVILLEDFLDVGLDGVSIGSNDLTMLVLGVDRDNQEVAPVFDERHPAVLWALERTIKTCLKNKVSCSICGQGPSEYAELVEKLVEYGITSISANPDVIEQTRQLVHQAETRLLKKNGQG